MAPKGALKAISKVTFKDININYRITRNLYIGENRGIKILGKVGKRVIPSNYLD